MNDFRKDQGLKTPIRFLKGVGEVRAELLKKIDIETVGDLLLTLPHRYEDRRQFVRIEHLSSGDMATVSGNVKAAGWVKARYGKSFFEVMLSDGSGLVQCRWFGAHYLQDQIKVGSRLVVYGKVRKHKGLFSFQHPEFEMIQDDEEASIHVGRIVPVYPLTENLGQRTMRRIAWQAVQEYAGLAVEVLPVDTRSRWNLAELKEALEEVHFPSDLAEARRARFRLIFEEFLCIQIVLVARKVYAEQHLPGRVHKPAGNLRRTFTESLPFELTKAQNRVIAEIEKDMGAPHPMHRLLQGDVGSGKTVVAACALLDAIECGAQAAVMAPTEILAAQHAETFGRYLAPLGIEMRLLTSGLKPGTRKDILDGVQNGSVQLVIGTHAILEEAVSFQNIGVVVIDEQHKFGVEQRGLLYEKGWHPDVLVMTATPIPRTLAMTVYGDLDVSIIDEMPKGRQEVVTRVIGEEKLPDAYGFIKKQVAKGRQAFLVYPLVAESEKMDLRSAEEMYRRLKDSVFSDERLALLHGQMSSDDKSGIMHQFRNHEFDILVATTVVEVGVDVPNANIMLVEHAERFGLAQLHQLRGRIGRGPYKSFCILQGDPKTKDAWKRLKVMEETTDGFKIAEEDLKIRGMGNLLGKEQSGFPALKVGDPLGDSDILQAARQEAFTIVSKDPQMRDSAYNALRQRAQALYESVGSFVKVG